MDLKDAIHLFEEKNGICINKFHSDRRQCFEKNLYPDQYIGKDIFENNIECWIENFDERKVFLQLLANYIYVPEIMYGLKFDDLLSQIVEKCEKGKEILKQTYFVTFPSSKGIKSGGDVIRDILPIGHLDCIKKEQLIADIKRNKKSISNAKCIVFIDDVIGSGRTAKRNITDFFQLEGIDFKEKKYFLAALYAESSIKKELEAELEKLEYKVELLVDHECRKCFSENYIFAENETESKNIIMEAEEKIAGKKVGEDKSYALGYGNSQLLLSFFYNTPNNTLCMFWKPTETNFPLFVRNSFHRPSLADIKRNREIKGRTHMKWQRKNGLKSNEILLLSYIYKYHRIDFADLQQELDLPRSAITLMVQKLYETGYINYSDESNKRMSMIITDKIDKKYVEKWSQWTKVKERKLEDEKDIFKDVLYVPKKFDTI